MTSYTHSCPFSRTLSCWGAQRGKWRKPHSCSANRTPVTSWFHLHPLKQVPSSFLTSRLSGGEAHPRSLHRKHQVPPDTTLGMKPELRLLWVLKAFFSRPRFLERVSPCVGSLLSPGKWFGADFYTSAGCWLPPCFLKADERVKAIHMSSDDPSYA